MEDTLSANNEQGKVNWPIFMLVLPPIGSLFVGTSQDWSDSITLILTGLYLYHLVKGRCTFTIASVDDNHFIIDSALGIILCGTD
jgi:hypothetical protein